MDVEGGVGWIRGIGWVMNIVWSNLVLGGMRGMGNCIHAREHRRRGTIAHTIVQGVGYGRDRPVALLVGPIGPINLCSGRWACGGRLGEGDNAGAGAVRHCRRMWPSLGKTARLQAHVVERGFNPWAPLVEHRGCILKYRHMVIALIPHL